MSDAPAAEPDSDLPAWLHPLREAARTIEGHHISRFTPPSDPAPREGAVLVLFGEGPEGPDLLLTERAHTMRSQPGHVSFPGGSLDEGEDAATAALREGQEEVGLDPADVEVIGVLPRLYLPPRQFAVAPVLAYWRHPHPVHVVNPEEVHAVFRVPLDHLTDPTNRFVVKHPLGHAGPAWSIGPDNDVVLWGFTAGVIHALLDYVGWAKPWDREVVRDVPQHLVDWPGIARAMGIELPEGEDIDLVALGLVPADFDLTDPAVTDRDLEPPR